jgi:hypothetical protein
MTAGYLVQLMGINNIDALQENLLRDRKLTLQPFLQVLVANVQLCSECLKPSHDLSSTPHRAGMYGRHVTTSLSTRA